MVGRGWTGSNSQTHGGGGGLCLTLRDPMDYIGPTRLLCSWDSPGKITGVGSHFLLQGIFPTQGSNLKSPALQADSLPTELRVKPQIHRKEVLGNRSLSPHFLGSTGWSPISLHIQHWRHLVSESLRAQTSVRTGRPWWTWGHPVKLNLRCKCPSGSSSLRTVETTALESIILLCFPRHTCIHMVHPPRGISSSQ